ncbi:MAG TPA: hypothetical protein QF564_03420 [Pirellulaceae bacterium]|jgi:hypothetical protein|nr:hypothetical protein [Pirellulaceae bacterium]
MKVGRIFKGLPDYYFFTTGAARRDSRTPPACRSARGGFAISIAPHRLTMPKEFDPYSQWLGILVHDRPVDHYCLLGIARFTSDPATIAVAADRRMALLRSYQTGPRGRLTQQLLNEVAAAKLCLINAPSRMAYDAMLEGLASATEPPAPAESPPQPAPSVINQSDLPEQQEPRATIAIEIDDEGVAEVWNAKKSAGASVGLAVLALAVVAIVAGTYVIGQVVDAHRRLQTIDPWVTIEDGERIEEADVGDGESSIPINEPVVVFQEADGSVNFTPPVAVLNGNSVHMETVEITDFLTGWTSVDDSAVWKCKIVKLPPKGAFRVLVTYRAATEADAGSFKIAIDGDEKTCQVRGTGEFVTDEYFLAVTRTGEQSMELRSPQLHGGKFEVRGIRLVMSKGEEER